MLLPNMPTSPLPHSGVQSTAWLCTGLSTSGLSENDTDYPSLTSQSKEIANTIWVYMGPIIFFIGLVGNVLILVVMSCKRMRGTSTSDYFIIMAVADLLTIVTGMIPEWLEAMGIFVLQTWNPPACKIYKFLSYSCGDTATWIRVLFTLDRFMAICFPMRKTDCCLAWRAKYYCLGAALAAVAKNLHVFWTRGAEYESTTVYEYVDCVPVPTNETAYQLKSNCGYPTPEYRYFETYVRPWIVFALVNLIPFCILLICNIFIIRAMIHMTRMREERRLTTKTSDWQLFQTTAMCLGASFAFLICVTPTMVLLIGKPYWTKNGTNMAYDIAKSISNQLLYLNHSINFFLYCITGRKFRETLAMLLKCRCADLKKLDVSVGRLNTARPSNTSAARVNGVQGECNGRRISEPDKSSRQNSNQTSGVGLELESIGEKKATDVKVNENELGVTVVVEEEDGRTTAVLMEEGILLDDVVITQLVEDAGESRKERSPASIHIRTGSESSSGVSSSTSNDDKSPTTSSPVNGDEETGDWHCRSMNHCIASDHCYLKDPCFADKRCTNRSTEEHCFTKDHCNPEDHCSPEYHCSARHYCTAEDHFPTDHSCRSTTVMESPDLAHTWEMEHGLANVQYSNTTDQVSINSLATDRTNTSDDNGERFRTGSNLVTTRGHLTVLSQDTDNCESHTALEIVSEDGEPDENTSQKSWEKRKIDLQTVKIDTSCSNATSNGHSANIDEVMCKNNNCNKLEGETESGNAEKLIKMIGEDGKFNGNVEGEREAFQRLEISGTGRKYPRFDVTLDGLKESRC